MKCTASILLACRRDGGGAKEPVNNFLTEGDMEKTRELEKLSQAAGTLGFHVLLVPAGSALSTRRQVALGLIGVLVKEYELENVVSVKRGVGI